MLHRTDRPLFVLFPHVSLRPHDFFATTFVAKSLKNVLNHETILKFMEFVNSVMEYNKQKLREILTSSSMHIALFLQKR